MAIDDGSLGEEMEEIKIPAESLRDNKFIKDNEIIVVKIKEEDKYMDSVNEVISSIVPSFTKIIYVSANKPYNRILDMFGNAK